MKVIECVPNFSEGRDEKVIKAIVDEIEKVDKVDIWDISPDKDHNRTVVTFVGDKDSVKEAMINSARKASELIDMRKHKGEHPRIGAVDVIPFIPLKNSSLDECVELANEVGEYLAKELDIPVYMYGEAAKRKNLKDLGYVQNIGYEKLFEKIKEEDYKPDYGRDKMNEKIGGSIVGARSALVAFNVNLNTDNIDIANQIARNIRESSGGLRNVKSMGVRLKDRNIVQVSMDMVNYKETPLYRVYELIKIEAKRYGVEVIESELIGLVPSDALIDSAEYYFKLDTFKKSQLIENRL